MTYFADVIRRSRDRAQSILSPGRWFGGQSDHSPAPDGAPSDSQPTPLPAFLAQSRQQRTSQAASRPAPLPTPPRTQQHDGRPAARSSHNTEWRWNLGGPSSGGSSSESRQLQQGSSGNATAAGQNNTSGEWRWNLGGAWQPSAQGLRPSQRDRQVQGNSQSQPVARENSRDSGVSQRPWQRRRVQAEASDEQPAAEAEREAVRADQGGPQGWRRLVPRFLRRGSSSQAGQDAAVFTGLQSGSSGQQGNGQE